MLDTVFSRKMSILSIILGLIAFGLIIYGPEKLSVYRMIFCLLIFWLGLIPGVIFLCKEPEEREPIPFMGLVGLFYGIFFGLSGIMSEVLRRDILLDFTNSQLDSGIEFFGGIFIDQISIKAQLLVIIGISLLLIFWWLTRKFFYLRVPSLYFPKEHKDTTLRFLVWALVFANLAYLYVPFLQKVPSIGQFLQPAGFLGLAFFSSLYFKKNLPTMHALIYFLICLPMWSWKIVLGGLFTPFLIAAGIVLASYIYFRHSIPWKTIFLIGVLFVTLYSMKGLYRTWSNTPIIGFSEKIRFLGEVISSKTIYNIDQLHSSKPTLIGFNRRIGLILSLSYVVTKTPAEIPYWNGHTYVPLITSWIPRAFWPNKPLDEVGYLFGTRYCLLISGRDKCVSSDTVGSKTSFNLPWLTELYVNFGSIGIIIGMVFLGVFLGFLDCVFNKSRLTTLEFSLAATILMPLSFQEQNLSVMIGSMLPLVFCLWVYFYFGLRWTHK